MVGGFRGFWFVFLRGLSVGVVCCFCGFWAGVIIPLILAIIVVVIGDTTFVHCVMMFSFAWGRLIEDFMR